MLLRSLRRPSDFPGFSLIILICQGLLASSSGSPLSAADPPETLARRLSRAEADLGRGDYPSAGNVARQILAEGSAPDPIRAHALTLLGKVLFFNSRVSFEAARSPEKGGTERRARSEEEERAREEGMRLAEQALRDAVQLDGSHRADARHYLAQVLLARGQRSAAREELAAYFEELGTGPADDRALRLRRCLGETSRLVSSEERTAAGVVPNESSSLDAVREVDGELEPPRRLSSPQPQYTEAARKARVQGVVIVQVIIEKTGEIRCAKPLVGLPLGLTEATLDAVSEWKFEPARFEGEPVSVFYNFTTNFRLQ